MSIINLLTQDWFMKVKAHVIMWQFTLQNFTAIIMKYQGNPISIDYFVVVFFFFLIYWKVKWLYSYVVAISLLPKQKIELSFC